MPLSRERNERDIFEDSDEFEDIESDLPARRRSRGPVARRESRKRRRSLLPLTVGLPRSCAMFGWLLLLVFGAVVICMALVMTFEFASFLRDPLDNFLAVFGFDADSEPEVVDSTTIVLGIQEMALLQTASGDLLISKTVVDTGAAPDAEITVSYIGHVTAGVDLALVTTDNILTDESGTLTIILPPAQLTGCYLGKPDIVQRNCTDIPLVQDCGKIVESLQDEAYDRALEELRETAYELNLLELAYQEAESRIFDLLKNLGHTDVTFQLSDDILPPSDTCFSD